MAQVSVLTVNNFPVGVNNTQHQQEVYGLVTFTGSGGYTTGGVPLDWTKMLNVDGTNFQTSSVSGTTKPFVAYFTAQDSSLVSYQYNAATNTLFAIAAGAQVAGAVTLAGVIAFEAHFGRGV